MTDTLAFLKQIHEADRLVMERIEEVLPDIATAANAIADRMREGGRWFYVGAGTSGRLGLLDAAELPPTFGVDKKSVVPIMAGGPKAASAASEEAEDDSKAGAHDLKSAGLKPADAVLGIAASGTTPFVLGALRYARELGALTVSLVCNPGTPVCEAA